MSRNWGLSPTSGADPMTQPKPSPQGGGAFEGHTPGPWTVTERETASDVIAGPIKVAPGISWHSSKRTPFPLRAESRANARLIAAAPDLLSESERLKAEVSALRAALQEIDALDFGVCGQIARAALTQAGEQG